LSVEEYYHSLLAILSESPFVRSTEVALDVRGEYVAFIRGDVYFADDSLLHFRELTDVESAVKRTHPDLARVLKEIESRFSVE